MELARREIDAARSRSSDGLRVLAPCKSRGVGANAENSAEERRYLLSAVQIGPAALVRLRRNKSDHGRHLHIEASK
ncbi:MAG: hypothetical protein C3F11_05695 [Methylocystaceae bacterium]|nr:MAG: hypothetical protein C3F11_05695 [Methylocystaceae bacterium]